MEGVEAMGRYTLAVAAVFRCRTGLENRLQLACTGGVACFGCAELGVSALLETAE